MRVSREILKGGCQSGKERDIKRKAKKEQGRLKVWQLSESRKPKMFTLQTQARALNKLPNKLLKKGNDDKILKFIIRLLFKLKY